MGDFREALNILMEDLRTSECAVIKGSEDQTDAQVISYSKLGLGGDGHQVILNSSPLAAELHQSVTNISATNRYALWKFIAKAIS